MYNISPSSITICIKIIVKTFIREIQKYKFTASYMRLNTNAKLVISLFGSVCTCNTLDIYH